MTDIQGALGAAQMDRASKIVAERRGIASRFEEAFSGLDWLHTPTAPKGSEHGYQSYPCLFAPEEITPESVERINQQRNAWMEELQGQGISTRPATHAVHMLSFYSEKYKLAPEAFPNAYAANNCSISLPLFHGMTDLEQDYVIEKVAGAQFT